MKLSYTDYKTYLECPKKYYYTVNRVPLPEKPSKYFALYGILLNSFFREYTNVYSKTGTNLTETQINNILNEMWQKVLKTNYVKWNEPWVKDTPMDIFNRAYEDVLKNIKIIDIWKKAIAETTINISMTNSMDTLVGRIDYIVNDTEISLLDGKGTDKIDQNVDLEQLYYYVLLYYAHYKKLPNKIGFLYYRYQTIHYIDYDIKVISVFKDKLLTTKEKIKNDKDFLPNVSLSQQCKWCPYKVICEGYINKKVELDTKKTGSVADLFNSESIHIINTQNKG